MDRGAGGGLGDRRVSLPEHPDPQLDVLPLQLAHHLAVGVPEAVQLAVVQGDQRAVVEREVDVPLDERVEDRLGSGRPVRLRQLAASPRSAASR
ncbi:hypothetical protein STENM327S_00965 [Streptomyces tendae]